MTSEMYELVAFKLFQSIFFGKLPSSCLNSNFDFIYCRIRITCKTAKIARFISFNAIEAELM